MRDPLRRTPRWGSWILAAGVAGVTSWMALDPTETLPFTPPFGTWNDKFLHAGAFALLAAIVTCRGRAPRALIALVVFAVAIETAQIAIPEREASLGDLAASLAGVIAGVIAGGLIGLATPRLGRFASRHAGQGKRVQRRLQVQPGKTEDV